MLAIYKLVYRIFFIYKNQHIEPFNTVHKIFCYWFLCSSRLLKLGDFAEYLSLSLYLLTTQMTVPFNYLPYFELEIGMLNRPIFNTYIFNQHIYDTRYQCMFHWLSVARLQHQNLFIECTDVYSATAHSVP